MTLDLAAGEHVHPTDVPLRLRRRVTGVLFATFLLFAPAPFSLLFIVGLVPLSCTALFLFRIVVETLGGATGADALLFPAILVAHLTLDGGILYLLAAGITRMLFAVCATRVAIVIVGLLVTGQTIASLLPVYLLAGEGDALFLSLWSVWEKLVFRGS